MRTAFLFTVALFFALFTHVSLAATLKNVETLIDAGEFTEAKKEIDLFILENDLSPAEIYRLNAKKEILDRITLDHGRDLEFVLNYVRRYYPEADEAFLEPYEKEGSLQMMIIDGKKRYFNRGASNLFLINKDAARRKRETDAPTSDSKQEFLSQHLPRIVADAESSPENQGKPVRMKVKYALTVRPDAVPAGETIRCWLPYPRTDHRRQKDVELLSANTGDYVISPDKYVHKSLYMEKTQEPKTPTVFQIEFAYTCVPEWFALDPEDVKPYDKESELYKTYTAERETHIVFTDRIKEMSQKIVGEEKDPVKIVEKIWTWIRNEYPWAGAREYSTFENIPEFVLENGHGDCGMVGLLLVTLARYNGVPAKWESGFMMYPGAKNLHDWAEVYFEGVGWVPIDPSHARRRFESQGPQIDTFYLRGIDAYRWIVNSDYSGELYPLKTYLRSETVDFQRGEVEWKGGNLYFNDWTYGFQIEYLPL